MRLAFALFCGLALLGTEGLWLHAAAQETRRFGAVTVACDTDRSCVAAIAAKNGEKKGGANSVLQISRSAAARSRWTISISTLAFLADRDRPVSVAVDGGVAITLDPLADYAPFVNASDFFILSQSALDRLMMDLSIGSEARFSYLDITGTPHTDRFSLEGLAAALREIDRLQERIPGDSAAGPPVDLPPAAEIDRQALVALAGVPPRLAEWHLISSTCEASEGPQLTGTPPIIATLSDTAMLYAIPCFLRNGRPNYRLYMIEMGEIGGMHTLYFAVWSRQFGWSGTDTLEAVSYDEGARRLTAIDLGGTGSCGHAGSWVFEKYSFRLEEMRAPPNCDAQSGTASWPALALP